MGKISRRSIHMHLYQFVLVMKIVAAVTFLFLERGPDQYAGLVTVIWIFFGIGILIITVIFLIRTFDMCVASMTNQMHAIGIGISGALCAVDAVLLAIMGFFNSDLFCKGAVRAAFTYDVTAMTACLILLLLTLTWPIDKKVVQEDVVNSNKANSKYKRTLPKVVIENGIAVQKSRGSQSRRKSVQRSKKSTSGKYSKRGSQKKRRVNRTSRRLRSQSQSSKGSSKR